MKRLIAILMLAPVASFAAEGLPLPEGYYVANGVACGEASDADVALVHANGMNLPDALCEFEHLEQTDQTDYSFAGTCAHPEQRLDYLNEGTISLLSATSFRFYDGTIQGEFTYCAPESLPANLR